MLVDGERVKDYQPATNRYEVSPAWYRRCGSSGLMLPAVSLGCWHNFGGAGTDPRRLPEPEYHANAQRMFLNSLMPVILSLVATLPGVLLIVFVPEGPLLGVGVILIVAGLFLETWWVNCRLAPRWLTESEKAGGAS